MDPTGSNPSRPRYRHLPLLNFAGSLLKAVGLAADRSHDVAKVLLEGDLLGHTTHGLALLPSYLQALTENSMEKNGEPVLVADSGAALTWDGRYLPGPWLVRKAIETARERLQDFPVVTVVIGRSHHIACLQAYLKTVTDAGLMILLTSCDPDSRIVAPAGGTAPRLSPNPIAAGIPTDDIPILIDISTSTTAHGVSKRAAAARERLPGPWLIDREGNPSDDPWILSEGGSLLPLGGMDLGHKGFALALIVEALTSALAGHGRADKTPRWRNSVFVQLIDPERFAGRAAFLREMTFLSKFCRETPAVDGKPPVRIPGEAALARREYQLQHGVELHPTILPALADWAKKLNVAVPSAIA